LSETLRVLVVEDSEDDTHLLIRELRKGGYEPVYLQVDSAEKLISALDNESWDIVITDYSLPGFSGMAAIKILNERDFYIPAIMVSGKMGEETAVEVMRAGANDYIIKGNFARLVPAIKRELREAVVRRERQDALEELRRSEVRYRAVVEDQTEAINRTNLDGTITFANSSYARLFDKTPEEIIGLNHKEILSEEDVTQTNFVRSQLSRDNLINSSEHQYTLADGEQIWLHWLDRLILDLDGNPTEFQRVGRDITEIKNAESELKIFAENLERYATQLQVSAEIARDAATEHDLESLLTRAAELVSLRFGFYHAGVFLLDDACEYAVLKAASGKGGVKLLEKEHKLKVGEEGIIGHVVMTGQPRISHDVGKDGLYFQQPLLPETRSEMAVPLKIMNRVIGAFDIQSKQMSAFDGNDLISLQTMADQLAIAIENMRLVIESQRRSKELSGLYETALVTSSVLDTNTLLERLYEQVQQLISPDAFIVSLYNSKNETFSIAFAMESGKPIEEFINKIFTLSEGGLTGWLLEKRKPLLIGDIEVDPLPVDPLPIEPIRGDKTVRTWLGVPLISRSNLIGAISVQSFQPNVFDISHQRFLESLAAQSAVAFENARLFEGEHAAREQAETLQEVVQVVGANLESEKVLELILDQLKRVITFDTALVIILGEQSGPFLAAGIGYEDIDMIKSQAGILLVDSKILIKMALDLQPIIIPDVREHPDWVWIPGAGHVRSVLGVPVTIREEMIGVLLVESCELDFYSEDELNTVQAIARHMAVANENANLFNAERIARENAEALRDAAQVIGSKLSLDEVIEAVLEQLGRVMPYDSASVIMLEKNQARVLAGRGYEKFSDPNELSSTTFPLDSTYIQEIVGKGTSLLIPDVREFPGWIWTAFSEHVRSNLGVPLRARDSIIGFFSLDRIVPNSFTDTDLEIGQMFAAHTSAAIENARLFTTEEKRAGKLEILRQVSLELTASLEPESVFNAILNGVFELIPDVQDVHIFTYNGEKLAFGAALWHDGHRGEVFSEPRKDGLTHTTALLGETIVVDDFLSHPIFAKIAVTENWKGSIVGIPLKISERVVGVLNVAHQKTEAFSEFELRILRLLGDQAALAIENARLFEQTMMERRHISLLFDVGQSLAVSLAPDTIQERALELTCLALGGNVGAIWISGPDEDFLTLEVLYAQGILSTENLDFETEKRLKIGKTSVGWCAQHNQAIHIPEVSEDERWTEIPYVDEEIQSLIAAPISDGQNLLGVMTILHSQASAFTDDHLELLQSICHQVGLALSNARRYQDINRLAELLTAEQNRLESLIEMLPVGVLLLDEDHHLLVANSVGRELLSIMSPNPEENVITYLGDIPLSDILVSQEHQHHVEIALTDPRRFFFEAQASQIGGDSVQWVLTLRDISQERETQERIQMQDRLATVGQLAAGIAHDFNNIMAAIVVYTDLLMMEPSLSDASQERLFIIQKQVERASSLIRQILDFSRRSVMEQSALNLLPFMKEMEKLLERTLPETIRLELEYQEGEYPVLADPTRLQQVFMNLAVNARDAMEDGGYLRFQLAHEEIYDDEPPVMDMPAGDWIRVSVIDTGLGINPEDLSRIFEPFFTTKPVGQGTGLGLAQVYGIVRQHDGFLDVKSQVGQGTQFDIFLPALIAPPEEVHEREDRGIIDGTGKTVLLVEDDPTTRLALQAMLDAHNFHVLMASNGNEALKTLNKESNEISLVVSDIVMPEMGGMDLYTIMQIRWPDIEILFVTGHPLENPDQSFLERGNVGWLQKPFSIIEFNRAIKRLLENLI